MGIKHLGTSPEKFPSAIIGLTVSAENLQKFCEKLLTDSADE